MTVNFRMNVNSPGSQLCLDFSKYFSDSQGRSCSRRYLKAQKTLCYKLHPPENKNGLRNLLFSEHSTLKQKNLCPHKGGWYELA